MPTDYKYLFLISILLPAITGCFGQAYHSIVVSEIMADPTPVAGLPDAEYLELYNRSGQAISLKDCKLSLGSRSVVLPDSVILPGHYVLLCAAGNYTVMKQYGHVIPLGALSLPNDGSVIALYSQGRLLYSVTYASGWWAAGKENGGYALEMIDNRNPCGGQDNWRTSSDERGGTPGRENSVRGNNMDSSPPQILGVNRIAANELQIVSSKRLDSLNAVSGAKIEVSGRKVVKRKLESPQFRNLVLTLDSPLLENKIYSISISNLSDCSGNILRSTELSTALPAKADSGDVVLNELLFNPPAGGVDFVEIYNTSSKYISLKNWSLGNAKNGQPEVFRMISTEDYTLPPFTYLALATDTELVKKLYPYGQPRHLLQIPSMPAFANASGTVILKDESGSILDHFDYAEDMHNPPVSDPKGVSLEKKDVLVSSENRDNWHSAASSVGNATPGYANSQIKSGAGEERFQVEPEAFTPDLDGVDDFARITYQRSTAGEIATIRIFDIRGHLIKNLVRNQLIGTVGEVRWDGTQENGNVVRTGYYLILIDTYDHNGRKQQYKLKVVVVRK